MVRSATLPALLWDILNMLERRYLEKMAGISAPSLDLWENLLRVLDDAGIECNKLPSAVRLSKRAVRARVSSAVRQGWVSKFKNGQHQESVRLTDRGVEAVSRGMSVQHEVEAGWRSLKGSSRTDKLRAALEKLVFQFPLEHPHYPASYGLADASITGGNGQDWKAVRRKPGNPGSPLPLSALLSQALVAFAMSYEEHSPVALTLSTGLLKRIPAEGRKLRDLGRSVGLSALQRHGFVVVSGTEGDETICLTGKGVRVSEAYDSQIQKVENRWSEQFGADTISELRLALTDATNTQK